jgi:hypothetical protein
MKDDAREYRTLKNRASMSLLLWSSTASGWARDLNLDRSNERSWPASGGAQTEFRTIFL